jgi:NADH:ubiquinone oxidoreductase subunit E
MNRQYEMKKLKNIDDLKNLREHLMHDVFAPGRNVLKVCCGLPCSTLGSHNVAKEMEEEASRKGLEIDIIKTGCQGL